MRRITVCLWTLAAMLVANSVRADHHLKPVKELKAMEWLIGAYDVTEAREGTLVVKWERVSDNFLRSTVHNSQGETHTGVLGVDPKTKQVTHWTFLADGLVAKGPVFTDGESFEIHYKGNLSTGEDASATAVFNKLDGGGHTRQLKDIKVPGQDVPDGPIATATPKKKE